MSKNTWIILSVILLLFGGLVWYLTRNNTEVDLSDIDHYNFISGIEQNGEIADHIRGNPNAPVVIIEYSDFQCPACASAAPRIRAILEHYDYDQVAFIVRNFPLANMFPNSRAAAASAEAAGLQGHFWEMRELLFRNQRIWSGASAQDRDAIFAGYAAELGLDTERFSADVRLSTINTKINFDQSLGREKGVSGTPTFFINGTRVEPAVAGSDERFRDLIDSLLRSASE
ncbi:DsbA family protein [Candidatus Saccharibacteria bacterium]|nr:DsbA family protein [Candidatus Saccharibacteria bacterium]